MKHEYFIKAYESEGRYLYLLCYIAEDIIDAIKMCREEKFHPIYVEKGSQVQCETPLGRAQS